MLCRFLSQVTMYLFYYCNYSSVPTRLCKAHYDLIFKFLMLRNSILLKGTEINNGTFVFTCVLLSSESRRMLAELLWCLSYKELHAAGLIMYFYTVADRF